jgi:hypothetical protein
MTQSDLKAQILVKRVITALISGKYRNPLFLMLLQLKISSKISPANSYIFRMILF